MIEKLIISNFKPFLETSVAFRPLTYLLGENGIGKSSITQAVLLLKQSLDLDDKCASLALNGPYTHIGNGVDALHQSADVETLGFQLYFTGSQALSVKASYLADKDVLPTQVCDEGGLQILNDMKINFLSANRVGPQLLSRFSRSELQRQSVDDRGVNALGLLFEYRDSLLSDEDPRVPDGSPSRNLGYLFDLYLSQVASGASIALSGLTNIDGVSSTFSFSRESTLPISNIRPTNVGFGLSYVSSVIIACLLAKPGSLLIFENPEAHLHTKGQRAIADLLAKTAAAGVQVICETHSRDLLYHTRKSIADNKVSPELANVLYVCNTSGARATYEWYPLTTRFNDLDPAFESFLEYFGGPMDFLAS